MSLPTSYTETTLATFMLDDLGDVAQAVHITVDKLAEAVNNVMLVYGVTDMVDVVDISKVRKIARVEAWRAASKQVAADFDFSEGEASYSRGTTQDNILKQLALAEQDAAGYYPSYQIVVGTMVFPDDPYSRLNIGDL